MRELDEHAPTDIRWLVARYKNWERIVTDQCETEAELRAVLVAAGIEDHSDSDGVEPITEMVERLKAERDTLRQRVRELEVGSKGGCYENEA